MQTPRHQAGEGKPLRQAVKLRSVLLWRHCGFCCHCYSEQEIRTIPCNSTSQDYKIRRCSLAGAAADETSGVMYGMLQRTSRNDAPTARVSTGSQRPPTRRRLLLGCLTTRPSECEDLKQLDASCLIRATSCCASSSSELLQ